MSNRNGKRPVLNDDIIELIKAKPISDQEQAARSHFQGLLDSASQPRHESANSCVRLCHFLDQCKRSDSPVLSAMAFSRRTCVQLFDFYVEWNEKNHHRSMRQVLELLTSLIILNPSKSTSNAIKNELLRRLIAILAHQSAQPFVKPAFKVLECFLGKAAVCLTDLIKTLHNKDFIFSTKFDGSSFQPLNKTRWWALFVSIIFDWMSLPDTSPVAGKLLVTFFQTLRKEDSTLVQSERVGHSILWQQWIRDGLAKYPDSLENIKNYLLPPLFKTDRSGSVEFLRDLTEGKRVFQLKSRELDAQAFLFLSAMEVGKKVGLIVEPHDPTHNDAAKNHSFILLRGDSIGPLLVHGSGNVRSAAFSVLVSSMSSVRPFPSSTLHLLERNLDALHNETDAKIRNEVLSHTKHMLERLKGSILLLARGQIRSRKMAGQSVTAVHMSNQLNDYSFESRNARRLLQEHESFLMWYLDFLSNELIPTASYQRHITALRAFKLVTKCGLLLTSKQSLDAIDLQNPSNPPNVKYDGKLIRLLLDLLMDPFEDVRSVAADLLRVAHSDSFSCAGTVFPNKSAEKELYGNELLHENVLSLLIPFITRTELACRRTGRADLADGVARTSELVYGLQLNERARFNFLERIVTNLEERIAVAEDEISTAVLKAPVHGLFASLRYIWDHLDVSFHGPLQSMKSTGISEEINSLNQQQIIAWIGLQGRIVRSCERVWVIVKDILCSDSPEGHLPQGIEDLDVKDTKDVLSYSFRAIHESSNLLRTLVGKYKPTLDTDEAFGLLRTVGNLSFEQLSTLRHRGAFSTVSLTFSTCCKLASEYSVGNNSGEFLLEEWYLGTLACINEQTSTTRRSAGIPALMTGILSSSSPSFPLKDVMAQLKSLSRQATTDSDKDDTNLPQVHAMNCIKEIFRSSTLGRRYEGDIVDCLQLAAESLRSQIWAIRNCGLLLLRSLIDCLFGTSKSKLAAETGWDGKSIRLSYDRYPALPQLLLKLLSVENEGDSDSRSPEIGAVESVFPALDIIRRAGPPKLLRPEIYSCIKIHLGSSVWYIRDISARTICSLLIEENWLFSILDLLETCGESVNALHGALLAVKYILERRLELHLDSSAKYLPELITTLRDFWWKRSMRMIPATIEAAYEDLNTVILRAIHPVAVKMPQISANESWRELRSALSNEIKFSKAVEMLKERKVTAPESNFSESKSTKTTQDQSALLTRAVTLNALYTVAIDLDLEKLAQLLIEAVSYDDDTASDMLDYMYTLWNTSDIDPESYMELARMYIKAYTASCCDRIRGSILRNLADVLEQHLSKQKLNQVIPSQEFAELLSTSTTKGSPDLANSQIRISGFILALQICARTQEQGLDSLAAEITNWGYMMSESGKASNDFDTRLAAVTALGAFFNVCDRQILALQPSTSILQPCLALYDALNDDDDEIREAGANVISKFLGLSLAPQPACEKLLLWLQENLGKTDSFIASMIHRITNSDDHKSTQVLDHQLAAAMMDDDSLFVEEDQNLYIDQVRETRVWISCLLARDGALCQNAGSQLLNWALHGLEILTRLALAEDGPYGYTSKPGVFAICMRIALTSRALVTRYHRDSPHVVKLPNVDIATTYDKRGKTTDTMDGVEAAISRLLLVGRDTNLHPAILQQLSKRDIFS